jgi:outer membrane protein
VKKTDFLDNKVMVESLRSMVTLLEKNEAMSQAALANTMGLSWKESIAPAAKEVPFEPFAANLDDMVSTAYEFSPDWARVQAGIKAAEGSVRTARSGFLPKLAVTGELHKWWNDYDAGMATDVNKEGWTVGVGLELPLFEGFLTRAKVSESKARLNQINEQKLLLQEGIGLMVKDVFLGLGAAVKADRATLEAMKSAEENRDLNTRAYQNELVETDKVIRAQLVEALMTAQHLKTRYDHIALQSQLNLIVGTELWKQLQAK